MKNDCPVVRVGGSAGGLGAYVALLKRLPVDLRVAVVIVNYVTRAATTLHEYLAKYTKMPVELLYTGRSMDGAEAER